MLGALLSSMTLVWGVVAHMKFNGFGIKQLVTKKQIQSFVKCCCLVSQLQEQEKRQSTHGNLVDNQKPQTRAETRVGSQAQTRMGTRAVHSRDALCLPDICGTITGSTYHRQLIPPKPMPLHHWRDLKNRFRHDYNLVPKPYKDEHIVKR